MVPTTKLSIGMQAGLLKSYFPGSYIQTDGSTLIWKGVVTPTPLSQTYSLKLKYELTRRPKIYVTAPKLILPSGVTKLKHVYSTKDQELCIFYPPAKEWHAGMYLTKTIIPWASDWLQHYECWVATGTWHGGGIEHDEERNKK